MKIEFDFEGVLEGKDEQGLTEIIASVDRDNALSRVMVARNEMVKAIAQHRLISLQLQDDPE